MAEYVNLVEHFNIDSIVFKCKNGQSTTVKRSLLPRIKLIYNQVQDDNIGDPYCVEMNDFEVVSIKKIIEWLTHYNTNPVSPTGTCEFSAWDDAFFDDLDGDQVYDAALTSITLEVEGFLDYSAKYIIYRFNRLPAELQIAFRLINETENGPKMLKTAQFVFKKE